MLSISDLGRCMAAALIFGAAIKSVSALEAHATKDTASDEDRQMAEQAVSNWDANGDNVLDVHEVLKVPGPRQVVRLWFRHDVNKDGRLTVEELTRVWAEQRGVKPETPVPLEVASGFPRFWSKPRTTLYLDDELRLTKYSPDGRHLAAAGKNAIHLLDAETGKAEHRIRGHSARVISVSFSPDSKTLVTASRDETVKFWSVASGSAIGATLRHRRDLFWAQFTPDGTAVVTAPDANAQTTVDVWAVPNGPRTMRLRGATGTVTRLAFSPDGELLASAEWDGGGVHVWNFRTGELLWAKRHSSHAVCVEFSPDGKTLATGGWDNVVRLWKVDSGKQLRSIRPSSAPVETVLWWPDGRWLMSGTRDGKIAVMDVQSGEIKQRFNAHSEQVRGLALSRDAKTVASCSTDKTLKLWDVRLRP